MNDQKIFDLIARKPRIRAVEISDALDQELSVISSALREMVDVGDVVQSKGFAPNGCQAMCYDFSEGFRATKGYRDIMDRIGAGKAAAAPAPAPASGAAPGEQQGSKVDRAVAYVLQNKTASDDELRTVMGIVRPAAPSAYLVSAVKAGRLHKGAKGWAPGRAPGGAAGPQLFNLSNASRKGGPVAQFPKTAQPEDPAPAPPPAPKPEPAPEPIKTAIVNDVFVSARNSDVFESAVAAIGATIPMPAPAVPVFRCGLWSDGVLELQRNGVQVAALTRGEGEHLADFIGRMMGQAEKVAA